MTLTASKGYTVSLENHDDGDIDNSNELRLLIESNFIVDSDIIIIRSRSKNKCRIFIIEEEMLHNEIVHKYTP